MSRTKLLTSLLAALVIAACASAPPPVNGEWDLMLTAAEGSTGFPISIEASGTEATASGGDAEFSGTWMDGELRLSGEFFVPEAGYAAPLDMTMRVEGDELVGTATWDQFEADVLGQRSSP